jgi:hypothetical protein
VADRKVVFVFVVAAHIALLWFWAPRARSPQVASRRVSLFIIAPPAVPATPLDAQTDRRIVSIGSPSKPIDARPTLLSLGRSVSASMSALPPAKPAAAEDAASVPGVAPDRLNLAVPSGEALRLSPLDAALNDPRSNTPHLSVRERMAQTLGTDTRLVEEVRPDGSVRVRQGTGCFDAHESRAASLDPYGAAFLPKPRQISAC